MTTTNPSPVQDMTTPAIERELARIPSTIPLPQSTEEFGEYRKIQHRRNALRVELERRMGAEV